VLIATLGEPREHAEHAFVRRADPLAADSAERARAKVLIDREVPEDPPALRHLHDAGADDRGRIQADQVAVPEPDRAAGDRAAL
jgi:hypothetical protein